jgi:hypothetical protein
VEVYALSSADAVEVPGGVRVILERTKPVHSRRRKYAVSRVELDTKTIPPGVSLNLTELIDAMRKALKKEGVLSNVMLHKGSRLENGKLTAVVLSVEYCANKGVVYSTVDGMCSNVWLEGNKLVYREPQLSPTTGRDRKRQVRPGTLTSRAA